MCRLLLLVMALVLHADGTQLLVPAGAAATAVGHGHLVLFRVRGTCLVLTPRWGGGGCVGHTGHTGHVGHALQGAPVAYEGHVGHVGHGGWGDVEYLWELRRWYYRDVSMPPAQKLWHRIRTSQNVRHLLVVHIVTVT